MPRVSDASSFTRLQKLSAQTISTATKKPTASSVPSASIVSKSAVSAVIKASAESKKATPIISVLATSIIKVNTSKRG